MSDNTAVIPVPGAKSPVEAVGTRGIFYSVRQGGEVLKRKRGAWPVAVRKGKTVDLRASGWLPGFQSLFVGNDRVYRFGSDVPLASKILCFAPLLLVGINPIVGVFLGLVLVFYNIITVKNPAFPTPLRIVLPLLHTVAGALILLLIQNGMSRHTP